MHTLGIDLAAEAKGTALAQIRWAEDRAELVQLQLGVEDEVIVQYALDSDKIGIDCALGWPKDFVRFLNAHSTNDPEANPSGDIDWRRRLSFRETDRQVRAITGRWPLSVATDREWVAVSLILNAVRSDTTMPHSVSTRVLRSQF